MQEEIKLKGESVRTIVKYFTNFSGRTSADGEVYYAITDLDNRPLRISNSQFDSKFTLNQDNYNVPLSSDIAGSKVYSGSVTESEYKMKLTQEEKDRISQRFIDEINREANPASQVETIGAPFSCVFFEEYPFTDYFMNIKLNRSVGSLDTLNVYNVSLNDSLKFNSQTGVLTGKLEAIQVLIDENGEKIRIPLKDTVVGIFNPSETFPNPSTSDEEGNRIRLSIYESIPQIYSVSELKGYGSFQSYLTDVSFSKNDYKSDKIPDQYKYTTITNERGEFILHNVPTGQQTLMIEVDLLKLGLEPEEVALNFFPYPTQEDPNVSELPHLFFGQYPINILPSWGEFQTGYTEVTLSVALDLRKWATYQIFPISSKYGQDTTKPLVLEELYAQGYTNPQTVLIRDMTKELQVYERAKVEVVKIPNIYDKNIDLRSSWELEYKVKTNKVEFDSTNYNAFKLPANLYDPNGINSLGNKGVWLNAYTFKVFYSNEEISHNATGMVSSWVQDSRGEIFASHFDLSFSPNWERRVPADSKFAPSSVGTWPYEKSWSLIYPDPYKITKKPSVPNPYKKWYNDGTPQTSINGYDIYPQLEPRFLDGDLLGGNDAWGTNANGFGLQDYKPGIFGNAFSIEVAKNELWRYEAMDWWADDFANGFNPGCTSGSWKYSQFPGCPRTGRPDITFDFAERFMRLESGYNYWLMPRGWPRIDVRNAWGDLLLNNDHARGSDHSPNSVYPGYYSKYEGVYKYLDEVTMRVGPGTPWWSKFGRITAYKVEKPYYTNQRKPPFIQKYVVLNWGWLLFDGTAPNGGRNRDNSLCNFSVGCGNPNAFNTVYNLKIKLKNEGSIKISFRGEELYPGETKEFRINTNERWTLPANARYNPKVNCYDRADYSFYLFSIYTGTDFIACAPYGGNTGERAITYQTPWNEWGGADYRLKYFKDNNYGLPAFEEGNSDQNYYLTSKCPTPIDWTSAQSYSVPLGDFDRRRSLSKYGRMRFTGLSWMCDHGWGWQSPELRWTRSRPETYMGSYTDVPDLLFRVLSGDGNLWANYDLDFNNIV